MDALATDSGVPASDRSGGLPSLERFASALLIRRRKSVRLRRGWSADIVFSKGLRLAGNRLSFAVFKEEPGDLLFVGELATARRRNACRKNFGVATTFRLGPGRYLVDSETAAYLLEHLNSGNGGDAPRVEFRPIEVAENFGFVDSRQVATPIGRQAVPGFIGPGGGNFRIEFVHGLDSKITASVVTTRAGAVRSSTASHLAGE